MIQQVRRFIGKLARHLGLLRIPDRRQITTYPDDVFIVSYPKSGNTWVRFLIAGVLHGPRNVDFTTIERLIPTIYHTQPRRLAQLSRPRTLKSHECVHPAYAKVIYIVRDPRDVAVSYFHFLRRGKALPMDRSIGAFVAEFVNGTVDQYGSWGEHITGWLDARSGDTGFLLIRYEDLLENTNDTLEVISRFLDRSLSATETAEITASCSSSRMRELEKKAGSLWIDSTRSDIPFVRKAISGGWREELDSDSIRLIENAWGPVMKKIGYARTSES